MNKFIFSLVFLFTTASATEPNSFVELISQGDIAFQQGNFQQATKYWETSLNQVDCEKDVNQCIENLIRLGAAYQELKMHSAVFPVLNKALSLAEQNQDTKHQAMIGYQLSDAWLSMRYSEGNFATLTKKDSMREKELEYWGTTCSLACNSVVNARKSNEPNILARALNNQGNVLTVIEDSFAKGSSTQGAVEAIVKFCLADARKPDDESQSCSWSGDIKSSVTKLATSLKGLEKDPKLADKMRNNLFKVIEELPRTAIQTYEESMQLAKQSGDEELTIKASLNRAKIGLKNADSLDETAALLNVIWQQIQVIPDGHAKITYLFSLGKLALALLQENNLVEDLMWKAQHLANQNKLLTKLSNPQKVTSLTYEIFQKAVTVAEKNQDSQSISKAYGYLGQLYERELRYEEALTLTRKSIFTINRDNVSPAENVKQLSLANHFSHNLYRLYWQQGRILKKQGQLLTKQGKVSQANDIFDQAIAAYRLASSNLKPIQQILEIGYRISNIDFKQQVKPVHYGLVSLLLRKAHNSTDKEEKQKLIREAIETSELVKVAELQNYFDECVLALQSKTKNLLDLNQSELAQTTLQNTAILYPVPLEDRLVVLAKVLNQDTVHQVEIPVGSKQFNQVVQQFRFNLQKRSKNVFLFQSQQLYDWLIRPIEAILKDVDTLVIVPDGYLRMIPLSTLHDGKQFLIEKYAMALTPGLALVNPQKPNWDDSKILLTGLTDSVQAHSALPNVPKELQNMQCLTEGNADNKLIALDDKFSEQSCKDRSVTARIFDNHLIFNKEFSIDKFKSKVSQNKYSVIHLATHGEFNADPDHTYLLTYDGKMKMDKLADVIGLGKFRDRKPLELLTLSACKTAVGNDKAALGLAGVAVKAGARSAIATLWYVEDSATAKAMSEFYRLLLETPDLSKAKALQIAQKQLIANKYYWHPSYWGPFLLIGNWL
ncbi:CHAT domain-containing protein [Candidatus Halobeggiatoa sp. HSG11]|nr:CHAT domain-containing protein [Candidatus Halobeggiatoa sp. HSG11]